MAEAYSSSSSSSSSKKEKAAERERFEGGSGGGGEEEGHKGTGVVLRVPLLYGEAEKPAESAVNVLMDTVRQAAAAAAAAARDGEGAEKIKVDHWALRYPTNTEDVARVCYGMYGLRYVGR